jgi:hypothetical protein
VEEGRDMDWTLDWSDSTTDNKSASLPLDNGVDVPLDQSTSWGCR